MSRTHTHPCWICHLPVECDGVYERNYDGLPEAVCQAYHLVGGWTNTEWLCDACEAAQQADSELESGMEDAQEMRIYNVYTGASRSEKKATS